MVRYANVSELPEPVREQAAKKLREMERAIATGNSGIQAARLEAASLGIVLADSTVISVAAKIEPPKPSKYRNRRTTVEGEARPFDSKLEASLFLAACEGKAAGEVAWITRQVPFYLEGGVAYRCDVQVVLTGYTGPEAVEIWDAKALKGVDKNEAKNKRKQVAARHGVRVLLWPRDAAESKVAAIRDTRRRL